MTTSQLTQENRPFTIAPITFDVQRELIQQLADEYMPLTVASVDDTLALKAVHEARMTVKNLRVKIEKRRKELKAESLEYGKRVDSAAKELAELLAPIEDHLEHEEAIVAREKERLYREAEEKRQAMIRTRLKLLQESGKVALASDVDRLSDDDFAVVLSEASEAKRVRDEQAASEAREREKIAEQQRIESERLAAETARLEKIRLDQEAEQRRIEAEKQRIADEEAERKRLAELEKAKAEAAEKARLEAIAEQERLAAEKKTREEAERLEQQRIEALRPDRDKLLSVAESVRAVVVPAVSTEAARIAVSIAELISSTADKIAEAANTLTTKKRK